MQSGYSCLIPVVGMLCASGWFRKTLECCCPGVLRLFWIPFLATHSPISFVIVALGPKNAEIRKEKWEGLVKAKKEGLVKNIGVSNYAVKHLKELLANVHGIKPATNQIYWNPTNQPRDILKFCKKEGILVVAYSSLGSTDYVNIREDPRIYEALLRWPIQDGIAIIPKAPSKNHIVEDIDLDFVIPEEDVQILNSFEQKKAFFDFNIID